MALKDTGSLAGVSRSPSEACRSPDRREGSETRRRSDQILKHVMSPTAEKCGYVATRADEIAEPGLITHQIIRQLIDDDLVIADLAEENPNAYYEPAIRHAIRKPVVQIIQAGEVIPFDVQDANTLHLFGR